MRGLELPSPAEVLLKIRNGEATSIRELLPPRLRVSSKLSFFEHHLLRVVSNLQSAGLIEVVDGVMRPTPQVEKVQHALEISLTDLSRISRGAIPVSPVFGAPDPVERVGDIFVLMPFSEALNPVYEDHLKAVATAQGLSISRADDFFAAESIVSDIWRAIFNAKIVIADCTGRNPNVFYEIGISHTIGKPTILISQSMDDVPFDLRHRRCIIYSYTPRGMQVFTRALTQALHVEGSRIGGSTPNSGHQADG